MTWDIRIFAKAHQVQWGDVASWVYSTLTFFLLVATLVALFEQYRHA